MQTSGTFPKLNESQPKGKKEKPNRFMEAMKGRANEVVRQKPSIAARRAASRARARAK